MSLLASELSYMSLFYTFVTEQNCRNSCHLAAYVHSSLAEIMKGVPFRADTLAFSTKFKVVRLINLFTDSL